MGPVAYTEAEQAAWAAGLPRKYMGAGVLITDENQRVLLVEPTYQDEWLLPGGIVEAGESPQVGALREVREELGLTLRRGRLLVVDYRPPRPTGGDSLNWVFSGGPVNEADIVLQEAELRSWAWCTDIEIGKRAAPRVSHQVAAGLLAIEHNTTIYLEDGQIIH